MTFQCDYLVYLNAMLTFATIYGVVIFIYWWIRLKKASPIFIYILLILISLSIENVVEMFYKIKYLNCFIAYTSKSQELVQAMRNPIWIFKDLLLFIALLAFLMNMSTRIYITLNKINKIKEKNREVKKVPGYQVLIVEDDAISANILSHNIVKFKLAKGTIVLDNAEDALEYLKENRVNMLITDMNLAGKLTGFDLLRTVKMKYPCIVNIGVTGYPVKYSLQEAREIGVDDYFQKPFRLYEMKRSMEYHKAKHKRWRNFGKKVLDVL